MKFVYFGSGKFSRIVLENLYLKDVIPALVVTSPDKPKGWGLKFTATEVSSFAREKKIPFLQPVSLNDSRLLPALDIQGGDFFVAADYGKIIPLPLISLPRKMFLGVHPSLLPFYRGAAPISRAIMKGEKITGLTIFKINDKVDAGEIILQKEINIDEYDDVFSLTVRLGNLGAAALVEAAENILSGRYDLLSQDEQRCSFAPKFKKEDGRINWSLSAEALRNLIRAILDWPGAYTYYKGKTIKILEAQAVAADAPGEPASIIKIDKQGIYIAAGRGILKITKVKPQDKKEMSAYAFVCGYRVQAGDKFE